MKCWFQIKLQVFSVFQFSIWCLMTHSFNVLFQHHGLHLCGSAAMQSEETISESDTFLFACWSPNGDKWIVNVGLKS